VRNTVIPGPREKRATARLDTVIVTAHLNADSLDTGEEGGEERSVRLPVRLLSSHRVYSPGKRAPRAN